MSRHGENIFKRKDGRWEGRYISGRSDSGKAKYSSVYAHSYAECSEKLKLAKYDLLPVKTPMTFSELFTEWLLNRKNTVKRSTYVSYKNLYEGYLRKSFGSVKIDSMNAFILNRYADELLSCGGKSGQGLSAATVQAILIMLRSVLEYGETEYRFVNPAKNISLPKTASKEIEVFNNIEMLKIRNGVNLSDSAELGILLALYTGMRIGEICALTWGDFDLLNQIIHIKKTLYRIKNPDSGSPKTIVVIDSPKSKNSVRDIPIPTFMLSAIAKIKRTQNDENYFLTGSKNYTEPRTYSIKYKSFLKRLEIPYRNFHNLRHTFATECVKQGVDVKTLSELLGHSSVKITLERYVHSDMELKRKQLEKLYATV